uniref:Uncharacterized protein n=1 Tax=Anguilla anguilla TaxID=7936 RepID=A0A0E9UBU3_ANGAN
MGLNGVLALAFPTERKHRASPTVSLLGSNSLRILKKFLPYCLSPLMNRFCFFS